ncbi:unnamed protein product [Ambrosiozyma monospora]|uniref:Nucleolar protein 16 n=1 Tax=Ambrosiozyma monospora TaxID=43982 RepID=A0A9W6SWG1_AMBMO|nr:unnamed protein product [Ambrosiozyma monospora]
MVSVRKRKMARSSIRKNTRRNKDKQRKHPILSNTVIAENWDKSLTLKQNYARLGLKLRLSTSESGGSEKKLRFFDPEVDNEDQEEEEQESDEDDEGKDEFDPANIPKGLAKLVKDEDGNVVKVVYGTKEPKAKPTASTGKKLGRHEVEEKFEIKTNVVAELEKMAQESGKNKKKMHLSDREIDWLSRLVEKYGDDFEKMKWDKKLNPNQFSAGELKKRIGKLNRQVGLA